MGAATGLHHDLAGWQVCQKRDQLRAARFTPQHLMPSGVLRMQMKRPLAQINSYDCNSFHDGLPKKKSPDSLPGYRG